MSCASDAGAGTIRLRKAAIGAETGHVKRSCAIILLVALAEVAAAQTVPLPRPRPFSNNEARPRRARTADACADQRGAVRLPRPADGRARDRAVGRCHRGARRMRQRRSGAAGGGGAAPTAAGSRCNPPAVLRCDMAEAIVDWVRDDLAQLAAFNLGSRAALGAKLRRLSLPQPQQHHRRDDERARQGQCARRALDHAGQRQDRRSDRSRMCRANSARAGRRACARASRRCWAPVPTAITRTTSTWISWSAAQRLSRDVPVGRAHARGQAGSAGTREHLKHRGAAAAAAPEDRATCGAQIAPRLRRRPIASGMIALMTSSKPSNLATPRYRIPGPSLHQPRDVPRQPGR